jgi:hypothetical protein
MENVAEQAEQADFPRAWLWESDGNIESAKFVKFDKGMTKLYGAKPIVVLEVDGEERSVWLTTTVLFETFKRELESRESHALDPGETISIRWAGKKQPNGGGPAYHVHRVTFHDSPGQSPEAMFNLGTPTQRLGESDAEPVAVLSDDHDDDIPY